MNDANVDPFVYLQMASLIKSLAAHITHKWFLNITGVDPLVNIQAASLGKKSYSTPHIQSVYNQCGSTCASPRHQPE